MATYKQANYPLWLKDIIAWLNNPNTPMYGRWNHPPPAGNPNAAGEGGVDITSPGGTPVYALAAGPIEGAGYFWHSSSVYTPNSGSPGYGVVTERTNVPGFGYEDIYYQHIKLAPGIQTCYADQCNGQTLQKGQLIGWVEPGVNEVEVGANANWGGVWGVNHPQAWVTDPRPLIAALATGSGGTSISPTGTPTPGDCCGGDFWCQVGVDIAGPVACPAVTSSLTNAGSNAANGFLAWTTQAGIVIFGALLVFGALMLMFKGEE